VIDDLGEESVIGLSRCFHIREGDPDRFGDGDAFGGAHDTMLAGGLFIILHGCAELHI